MKIIIHYPPPAIERLDDTREIDLRAKKNGNSVTVFRDGDAQEREIAQLTLQAEEGEAPFKFTCEFLPAPPHDLLATREHDIEVVVTPSGQGESLDYNSDYGANPVTDRFQIKITEDGVNGVSIQFPIVVKPPEGPPPLSSNSR